MRIEQEPQAAHGVRLSVKGDDESEVARAYLYIMHNDLHEVPFGLLEDVYVEESHRGEGVGTQLVQAVIDAARDGKCYKLIATSRASRPKVHALYERLGFKNHGFEFRMDLGD
jgi:GNAT superfamily N-acetyltransferase